MRCLEIYYLVYSYGHKNLGKWQKVFVNFSFLEIFIWIKKKWQKKRKKIFTNVVISTEKISFPTCIYFKIFHRLRIDICVPLSANFIKLKIRSEILIEIDNFARQWWLHVGTIVLSVYSERQQLSLSSASVRMLTRKKDFMETNSFSLSLFYSL